MDDGCPSIAASASMPPTPHPTTPRPFTIVVCESVPKTVSGIRQHAAVPLLAADDAREVLDVDLVHDAGFRRHDAEVVERGLAPAEERVALAVAVVLELGVQLQRVGRAEVIHLHRVIDDELHGLQRVDLLRVAAERDDAVAHRGEIHDAGHAREVLQQDARGHERDFLLPRRRDVPARQRAHVVGLHEPAIFAAQQVLEQDLQRVRQPADAPGIPRVRARAGCSTRRSRRRS